MQKIRYKHSHQVGAERFVYIRIGLVLPACRSWLHSFIETWKRRWRPEQCRTRRRLHGGWVVLGERVMYWP